MAYFSRRSYWRIQLNTGKMYSEHHCDWTLDIVSTGDVSHITDIFLDCPKNVIGHLPVKEKNSVFQFKTASIHALGEKTLECQIIGTVLNKEEGICKCLIWDKYLGLFTYITSIYKFGSWRSSLLPIGQISQDVLGLKL